MLCVIFIFSSSAPFRSQQAALLAPSFALFSFYSSPLMCPDDIIYPCVSKVRFLRAFSPWCPIVLLFVWMKVLALALAKSWSANHRAMVTGTETVPMLAYSAEIVQERRGRNYPYLEAKIIQQQCCCHHCSRHWCCNVYCQMEQGMRELITTWHRSVGYICTNVCMYVLFIS